LPGEGREGKGDGEREREEKMERMGGLGRRERMGRKVEVRVYTKGVNSRRG
jgi:hypothetical protein